MKARALKRKGEVDWISIYVTKARFLIYKVKSEMDPGFSRGNRRGSGLYLEVTKSNVAI